MHTTTKILGIGVLEIISCACFGAVSMLVAPERQGSSVQNSFLQRRIVYAKGANSAKDAKGDKVPRVLQVPERLRVSSVCKRR